MKNLSLICIIISSFCFGQFKVTESSADYKNIGQNVKGIQIFQKEGKAKIEYLEFKVELGRTNLLSPSNIYTFEFF